MRRFRCISITAIAAAVVAGCVANPDRQTLGQLRSVQPDLAEVQVDRAMDLALLSYRRFLEETPTGAMTPEAMRRLADLQLEREFGITGDGSPWIDLPAPEPGAAPLDLSARQRSADFGPVDSVLESDEAFERRTTQEYRFAPAVAFDLSLPGTDGSRQGGPLEAIAIYQQLLAEYPTYERNDQVLYQMARAYDELGRTEEAIDVMQRMIGEYGYSRHADEVQFRRGEYFFTRRMYLDAESAYGAITAMGPRSDFYELALYKLGWTFYKQDFYEEALHEFMALLDYKLQSGYDFDQAREQEEERRVEDTFRVVSLSFSNLGGPEALAEYFTSHGQRSYEDRIYANLGEFYLDNLRYQDAASVYASFVERYPFHRVSPAFGMRIVEIYETGGFPRLVVESKKEFATRYGLRGEYWRHYAPAERPDVLAYLKTNLTDLANHYHALYQEPELEDEQPAHYAEALIWYREFLASFPEDEESPDVNYQLADLLLENSDFLEAAIEYERTAYDYASHERAPAAGYAAIFSHREHLKAVTGEQETVARRATVASSLRFADTFPAHQYAPDVLGAAAEDLYAMSDHAPARSAAQLLLERYAAADRALRRSAWTVVAHSSFELAEFEQAEPAYAEVLILVPPEDPARQAFIDNLAASIYKQGELANEIEDYEAAAAHFLRVRSAAPTSEIRAAAEYDAAAALMQLQNWSAAAFVLDEFRAAFPEHELEREATRQLAFVYREDGELSLAAREYERVAAETGDPELRRDALLEAGELHEQAGNVDGALAVYERYVDEFTRPADIAVEIRHRVASMYEAKGMQARYQRELEAIVAADRAAGPERTDRTRYLAAQSALVLARQRFAEFAAVPLVQPFEQSLVRKRELMDRTLTELDELIGYEVGEVTAAATYFIAETYHAFSIALLASERPTGLSAAELADYEDIIEQEAFPFEELAIDVHEKNLELVSSGLYNRWIEDSLERLAELMPGRYARAEESVGLMGSIDSYDYRVPGAVAPEEDPDAMQSVETESAGRRARARTPRTSTARFEMLPGLGFSMTEEARISASVRAAYDSAIAYLEQGQEQRGIAMLLEVTGEAPELANPHVDLGLAYSRIGDLEAAATSFANALQASDTHPLAHNELGLIYRRLGRFGLARDSYEQALAAYPDLHLARKNLAILCDIYLRDFRCALEHYEAYAALVPENAQAEIWIFDIRNRLHP
jgi:cellulose synthase operon protein C